MLRDLNIDPPDTLQIAKRAQPSMAVAAAAFGGHKKSGKTGVNACSIMDYHTNVFFFTVICRYNDVSVTADEIERDNKAKERVRNKLMALGGTVRKFAAKAKPVVEVGEMKELWAVKYSNGEMHRYDIDQMSDKFGIQGTVTDGMSIKHKISGEEGVVLTSFKHEEKVPFRTHAPHAPCVHAHMHKHMQEEVRRQ